MSATPEAGRRRLTPWLIGVGVVTFEAGVGIFLAYLADDALTSSDRWRLMFALE